MYVGTYHGADQYWLNTKILWTDQSSGQFASFDCTASSMFSSIRSILGILISDLDKIL